VKDRKRPRSRLEVIYDILIHCREPVAPSRMLMAIGLNHTPGRNYIIELCEKGLLEKIPTPVWSHAKFFVVITDKGKELLGVLEKAYSLLGWRCE